MRALARLALPMLLAALAACEHQGGATQASLTVTPPPVRPAPGDDEEIGPADRTAVPADLAINPVRLNGLTQRTIRAALGTPNFRRRDKGVEIWQYYGEGCVLDLFIYEENGQRLVTHHQIRSTTGEQIGGCFRGIIDSRRTPQAS